MWYDVGFSVERYSGQEGSIKVWHSMGLSLEGHSGFYVRCHGEFFNFGGGNVSGQVLSIKQVRSLGSWLLVTIFKLAIVQLISSFKGSCFMSGIILK